MAINKSTTGMTFDNSVIGNACALKETVRKVRDSSVQQAGMIRFFMFN